MSLLLRFARAARAVGIARRALGDAAVVLPFHGEESPAAVGPDVSGGNPSDHPCGHIGRKGSDGLPTFVDWIRYGAVTPIQNQGRCGSCFAHAAAASLEGAYFIKTKKLVKISEQHIIDFNNLRNYGCFGGSAYEAFLYLKENGGAVLSQYYPYIGTQSIPKSMTARGVTLDQAAFEYITSEWMLKWAVAQQPICVSIGADSGFFKDLEDGVPVLDGQNYTLDEMDDLDIRHAVAVVAYGVTNYGEKVWVVKNSYGGDKFLLIARDTGKDGGAFGISRMMSFPILKESGTRDIIDVTMRSDKELGQQPRLEAWPKGYVPLE